MIAETALLSTIAIVIAIAGFLAKALDSGNETAFKALNLLAAALFAIVFFLENATIAMAAAIVWALAALLFIIRGPNREQLRGWDEELWTSHKKQIIKKKRKPREKKPEQASDEGGAKIWPWS